MPRTKLRGTCLSFGVIERARTPLSSFHFASTGISPMSSFRTCRLRPPPLPKAGIIAWLGYNQKAATYEMGICYLKAVQRDRPPKLVLLQSIKGIGH